MSLTISCPHAAQLLLRELYVTPSPHSVEALTRAFLSDSRITEQKVRELAVIKGITLSAVVRGLVCHKHPHVKPAWPLSNRTPAQVAGAAKRSRSPNTQDLQRAVELLSKLLSDPDDGRTKAAARAFVDKHQPKE
jgi:hypothetical protein